MPLAQTWGQLVADAPESVGFKTLPPGDYDFKIIESELKKSQSDKDGFKIVAEVEAGSPYAGQKLFNTFWVSPESQVAMGIFFRQFAALGLTREYFQAEPTNEQIVAALVGRRFRGTVTERDYNGAKQNDLKNVSAPSGPAPAAVAAPTGPATVVSAPTPTPAPATPTAAPTAAPQAPDAAWGSLPTPAAPAAPAAPTLPPLGPDNPPF